MEKRNGIDTPDGNRVKDHADELLEKLEELLKLTREMVEHLEWIEKNKTIMIHFEGGFVRLVNVECDSEIGVIRDVLDKL